MPRTTPATIRRQLRKLASAGDAAFLQSFFKTGPGQYGEGDRFLGIRVPILRSVAREHRDLTLSATLELLGSRWHEERLLALIILVNAYAGGDTATREEIYRSYLANTGFINNWDLVDTSAANIVGAHLWPDDVAPLVALAGSPSLWERRIAIVATHHFTRQKRYDPTLRISQLLLRDQHDLIHKATGWMLREVGKRDQETLERFLRRHCKEMPRTALRYAIERFPKELRQYYMAGGVRAAKVKRS
jgi:3-methyladenine DNA glycosylase AlkD